MENKFSSWKIYLAVFIGLSISFLLIYNALQQQNFIAVKEGTHCWQDANNNGKIDYSNPSEFKSCVHGGYKQQQLVDVLQEIHWSTNSYLWIFAAICCMFGRDLDYIFRIRTLTHQQLSWKASVNVILLWEFASALSPGVVGGVSVAMFILNKEKIALGRSTAIVLITALLDNLFFILLIPVVFMVVSPEILFPTNGVVNQSISLVFWSGFFIVLSVCIVLFISIFKFPTLLCSVLKWMCKVSFLQRFQTKIAQLVNDLSITSKQMKSEKILFWAKCFGATILSWTCRYLVINCVMAAFIPLTAYAHFIILGKQLVLWLFMHVSPTPGGSGVAEFAFGELMGSFSNSAILIVGLAILWRLISYFPYLVIGAILVPAWFKSAVKKS